MKANFKNVSLYGTIINAEVFGQFHRDALRELRIKSRTNKRPIVLGCKTIRIVYRFNPITMEIATA